ncbi:MAG: T9SS type A sorting domain-containing protein [Cytophagales bacterium]|nr:T9SS type A sorting domain-containing protein [Cytophagales bacterium]
MRKFSLSMLVVLALSLTTTAQIINVTGGPGRVNNSTVIEGLPFTATVTGLNGTPQRWTVGIGDINNQLIFNTSSTTITNAIVDRSISGNTAVISVGATNGRGVARFLTVQQPPSCNSDLLFLQATDCSLIAAILNPVPSGATGYSWSVSPSVPFTVNGTGTSITLNNTNSFTTYTVSVTITGGVCNGATVTNQVQCTGGGFLDRSVSPSGIGEIKVFPNPVSGNELNLEFGQSSEKYRVFIFSETGQPVEGISVEKQGNGAKLGVGNLSPGTYYLRTIDADGNSETQRFKVE